MTLTKQEVCALLHISDSTLQRRMKAGVYQFTREMVSLTRFSSHTLALGFQSRRNQCP